MKAQGIKAFLRCQQDKSNFPSLETLTEFMKPRFCISARLHVLVGLAAFGLCPGGATAQTPFVQISFTNNTPQLVINGATGGTYLVECTEILASNKPTTFWRLLDYREATNSSWTCLDLTPSITNARYYRVALDTNSPPPNPDADRLVWIPAGTFTMGSPNSEPVRWSHEGPQTVVTISRGFCMGKYEVTQAEYLAVMGNNPSYFMGDLSRPVEQVSWNDAVAYCAALTTREQNAGRLPAGYVYRLPTEAEWEYTCRAGTTTPFHYGSALRSGMANFDGHYEYPPCGAVPAWCYNPSGIYLDWTTSVGSYAPNAWGLYDMHGNVWEWCQDWYGAYPGGSVTDPQGPATGSYRVIRGGCWGNYAYACRSASRDIDIPSFRGLDIGFRVVLAPGQP